MSRPSTHLTASQCSVGKTSVFDLSSFLPNISSMLKFVKCPLTLLLLLLLLLLFVLWLLPLPGDLWF